MTDFFKGTTPVKFEGPNSASPLAYRHYDKDEMMCRVIACAVRAAS